MAGRRGHLQRRFAAKLSDPVPVMFDLPPQFFKILGEFWREMVSESALGFEEFLKRDWFRHFHAELIFSILDFVEREVPSLNT